MKPHYLITFILFLLTLSIPTFSHAHDKESAYDRVMRTGTLRCGYFLKQPVFVQNANSGEFSGIFYDYVEKLAKNLSLKIDWVEEIGLGDYPSALNSGRIDAMCSGIWIISTRSRAHDFTSPLYYLPLHAYVRKDDHRFKDDIFLLNNSQYTVAILEGGATDTIQRELFPKSTVYSLPQLTSPADLFISLDQEKADAVIYDPFVFETFDKNNPDLVKQASKQAIKTYPNAIAVKYEEDSLRKMLSLATLEMHLSGEVEEILKKHEKYPSMIYRVAKPYEVPK